MDTFSGKTVWIIGASSGIGAALAVLLSQKGANLIISSRDAEKLSVVQSKISGHVTHIPFDVSDATCAQRAAEDAFSKGKVDSVVFMAAQYEPSSIEKIDIEKIGQIIDVNLKGAFYVTQAVLPHFYRQGEGQIALCGSVAGYRGLPKGQPYSATKAGVMSLAESLRCEVAGRGIDVKLISPGFVKTGLTAKNDFTMPMMIEAEEAAEHIAKGLLLSKFEIRFPALFTSIMKMIRVLPDVFYFHVFRLK